MVSLQKDSKAHNSVKNVSGVTVLNLYTLHVGAWYLYQI